MKQITTQITGLLLSFFLVTCQKSRLHQISISGTDLVEQAKIYFKDSLSNQSLLPLNPRTSCPRTPQWTEAYTVATSCGQTLIIPIAYTQRLEIRASFSGPKLFAVTEQANLIFYYDHKNHIQAELITKIPDSSALKPGQTRFSGEILVENWSGERLDQFRYVSGGTIYRAINAATASSVPSNTISTSANLVTPDIIVNNCQQISGYNYSDDDPDDTYSWSEPVDCNSVEISDNGYYSGLSPADLPLLGKPPLPSLVLVGGSNPIADIAAYFKCFTNSTGIDHTYNVTVCVSQPVPGSREAWAVTSGGPVGSAITGNPVTAGHTFLVLAENSAGTIITRNVGFYPQTNVSPTYPSDQGQLDDNEQTGYDISLTYAVTNQQFFNILNYVSIGNNSGYLYNLSSNNCSTFALHALAAGDINLSSQQGSWPGGYGYDPGDLGEDIRSMTLPINATRNTVSNPHPNQGNCN